MEEEVKKEGQEQADPIQAEAQPQTQVAPAETQSLPAQEQPQPVPQEAVPAQPTDVPELPAKPEATEDSEVIAAEQTKEAQPEQVTKPIEETEAQPAE